MRLTRRHLVQAAAGLGAGASLPAPALDTGPEPEPELAAQEVTDDRHRWRVTVSPSEGMASLGLDSEGGGRDKTNLLAGPVRLLWSGHAAGAATWTQVAPDAWSGRMPAAGSRPGIEWSIFRDGQDLVWRFTVEVGGPGLLTVEAPFNALVAPAVVVPAQLSADHAGAPPWLLIAPDFGHLRISASPEGAWTALMDGVRGGSAQNAPITGVDPRLRGQAWLEASKITVYRPGLLTLSLRCVVPGNAGGAFEVRFRPEAIAAPAGLDAETWAKIRRPYLNHWQPCGTWCGPERTMLLANNVLSDPASISLWSYSEPMLFLPEPVPGIDLRVLLRRSLDYYLDEQTSAQGHVNAFGKMYDLYVSTGATLLIAAWDYWVLSRDEAWLRRHIDRLHLIADYLLRRDVDGDGLVESYGSGNAGSLRDPDRADIWFEMMNFGHKNTWTNCLAYRAFLCLAEMLEAAGNAGGAGHYRDSAQRLRQEYVRRFLSARSGWFVSWISMDGRVHDYCHTFINGMAVAYGMVPPEQGRVILSRVAAKSRSIGFERWELGIPANLLPCRRADMILPPLGSDGQPVKDHWGHWPKGMTERSGFGHRYPNGTLHPALTWHYLLGLQVAGMDAEADRILSAMVRSAQKGIFQNGIVNVGYGGAEHFYIDGMTCGYEGYLPESYNFLMACFTRDAVLRETLLRPLAARA
jgi:hypothetical protein